MLKKRIENNGLVKCIFESSNILASTYDKTKSDLTIIFNNGGSYTYSGVKNTDYFRFETEESQGKSFAAYIKAYPFIKNDKVDVGPIKDKLTEAIKEEKTQIAKEMIDSMKNLIAIFEEENIIAISNLSNVEGTIRLFKEANGIVDETE